MLSAAERAVPAQRAAARGVLSNVALVDLFGDIAAGEDSGSAAAAVASDLRSAYVDPDRDDRLSALRAQWDAGDDPFDRDGRLVMTSRAAARVAPPHHPAHASSHLASLPSASCAAQPRVRDECVCSCTYP